MNLESIPNSRLPIVVSLWFMTIVVLASVGPFGTYETLTAAQRLGYWGLIVTLSCFMDLFLRQFYTVKNLRELLVRRLIFVIAFSLCLYLINIWVFQYSFSLQSFLKAFSYVLIVSICIEAVLESVRAIFGSYLDEAEGIEEMRRSEDSYADDFETLLQKLPEALRGPIWHLEARGHYLGVRTDQGDAQILMRFSDAITGLPLSLGVQTHRSHWVALEAAMQMTLAQGKHFVELPNQMLVPISKSRLQVVESALQQS